MSLDQLPRPFPQLVHACRAESDELALGAGIGKDSIEPANRGAWVHPYHEILDLEP
jgi:hypothetical protein